MYLSMRNEKKSKTEMTASVQENKANTQEVKIERFLVSTRQNKERIFGTFELSVFPISCLILCLSVCRFVEGNVCR